MMDLIVTEYIHCECLNKECDVGVSHWGSKISLAIGENEVFVDKQKLLGVILNPTRTISD